MKYYDNENDKNCFTAYYRTDLRSKKYNNVDESEMAL